MFTRGTTNGNVRQDDIAGAVFTKQIINELIHVLNSERCASTIVLQKERGVEKVSTKKKKKKATNCRL